MDYMTDYKQLHGHDRAEVNSILWHFHNYEHGYKHCEGSVSNPYEITHINGKHGISFQYARGHGINKTPQWFKFTTKIGNLWDLESGTEIDVKDVPDKYKIESYKEIDNFTKPSEKSVTQLRAEIEKLREEYTKWKADHPNSQNEQIINKFLLIKAELKKRKKSLSFKETDLDLEAKMLTEIAKIKAVPVIPTEHTFEESTLQQPHKCKYCDRPATLAIIWAEGRAFIPVCDNHKEKAIHQIEKINHDEVEAILFLPEKKAEYAPVDPSGKVEGKEIKLKDIEPYFKDFAVSSPVSWIVGGIVTHPEGTKNDIDVLLSIPSEEEFKRIIEFRISRMFPKKLQGRLHLLTEERGGLSPFTDYVALYRLVMERIPGAEIVKMGELDLNAEIKLRTKDTEKQRKEAEKALKSDKITPGEFWLSTKPVRGYYPGRAQTLELFLDIYDEHYEFPSLSSKKFDGEHLLISKLKNDIVIHSEDGEIIEQLKNLKKEIAELKPEICVLEAEVENWDYSKKQHYPRETVHTGVIEDNFTANVFDCLYYKGEIPDELFEEIETFDRDREEWIKKYL